jgi:hypothetical protein
MNVINPYLFAAAGNTDPYFSSVSLLAHCDGANNSTTLTDSSSVANTFTANVGAGNTVKITTAQSVFGGASSESDGSWSWWSCPDNAAFAFGSGDLTIEMRVRRTASTTTQVIAGQWASGQSSWLIQIDSGVCKFYYSSDGTTASTITIGTLTNNTWAAIAISRVGNSLYTFFDGTLANTASVTGFTFYNSTNTVVLGGYYLPISQHYTGQIDEVRVTKGVGRYSATYTLATAAFPNS